MKRILALILAAVMCMALVACGTDAEETTADTAAETTAYDTVAETTAETTAAVTEAETTEELVIAEETDADDDVPAVAYSTLDDAVAGLELVLDSLKTSDIEGLMALSGISADNMDESTVAMIGAMLSKLDYSFGTPVDGGDGTATMSAEITSVDMNGVLMEYISELANHVDDEDWDADGSVLISMMAADDAATVTTTVTVNFEQVADSWIFSGNNEEFISAIFGGLM